MKSPSDLPMRGEGEQSAPLAEQSASGDELKQPGKFLIHPKMRWMSSGSDVSKTVSVW